MPEKPTYEELEQRIQELEASESKSNRKLEALQQKEYLFSNLFKSMLHEVHVWKLVFDDTGNIKTWKLVDANPAALKSWNKTLPEIVGKTTDEIFPNSNAAELFMPIVRKIFAEGTPHTWETYFPNTNQFLSMVSIPLGEYFISTGLDITERMQAVEALENERGFLSAVLDNIEESIVICNAEGRLARFNEAARRLHGIPEKSISPDEWADNYDLYQKDGRTTLPMEKIPLYRALQGERVKNAEIVVAARHSDPRFLVCNGQALYNSE